MTSSPSSVYTPEFFGREDAGSRSSAEVVLAVLLEILRPRNAVDVGCGLGAWTGVLLRRGVDAVGVDGDYVDRQALQIPPERFLTRDLSRPFKLDQRYDLAISMEVAEHLPAHFAPQFVKHLADLAPVVLFSAAIPNQGGVNHLNEQWQSYWVRQFARLAYQPFDVIRPAVWDDASVRPWYAQNALLYVHADHVERVGVTQRPIMLDVVHPRFYTEALDSRAPAEVARRTVRRIASSARRALRTRIA